MKNFWLVPAFLLLAATPAWTSDGMFSLYAKGEKAIQDFQDLPVGLEAKHLHTPLIVGFEIDTGHAANRGGFWFDLHTGWLAYTAHPAIGIGMGPVIKTGTGLLTVGLEVESNGALNSETSHGYLDVWRWGGKLKFDLLTGHVVRPWVEGRIFFTPDAELANFEGLKTQIGHTCSFEVKPAMRFNFWILQGEASVAAYLLGKTAISSKAFAFPVDSQMVFKPEVGAGFDFGRLELWGRASAVFPARSGDTVEYLYMAPWYMNDNLMTKKAISLEVRLSL